MAYFALLLKIDGIDDLYSTDSIYLSGGGSAIPLFGQSGLVFGMSGLFFGLPFASGISTIPLISRESLSSIKIKSELVTDERGYKSRLDESLSIDLLDINEAFTYALNKTGRSILNNRALLSIVRSGSGSGSGSLLVTYPFFVSGFKKRNGVYSINLRQRKSEFLSYKLPKITGVSTDTFYPRFVDFKTFLVLTKNKYDATRKKVTLNINPLFSATTFVGVTKNGFNIQAVNNIVTGDLVRAINNNEPGSFFEAKAKKNCEEIALTTYDTVYNVNETLNSPIPLKVDGNYTWLAFSSPYFYGILKNDKEFIRANFIYHYIIDTELVKKNELTFSQVTRGYFLSDSDVIREGRKLDLLFGFGSLNVTHAEALLTLLCSKSDTYYLTLDSSSIASSYNYTIGSESLVRNGFFVKVTSDNYRLLDAICEGDFLTVENWPSNALSNSDILGVEKIRDDVFCIITQHTVISDPVPSNAKIKIKSKFNKLTVGLGIGADVMNYRESLKAIMAHGAMQGNIEVVFDASKSLFEQVNETLMKPFGLYIGENEHGMLTIKNGLFTRRNSFFYQLDFERMQERGVTFYHEADSSESASFGAALYDYSPPDEKFLQSVIYTINDAKDYMNSESGRYVELKCYQNDNSNGSFASYIIAKNHFKMLFKGISKCRFLFPSDLVPRINLSDEVFFTVENKTKVFKVTSRSDELKTSSTELSLQESELKEFPSFYNPNECRIAPSLNCYSVAQNLLRSNIQSIPSKVNRFLYPFGINTPYNGFDYFLSFVKDSNFSFFKTRASKRSYNGMNVDFLTVTYDSSYSYLTSGSLRYAGQSDVTSDFDKSFYRLWAKIGKAYSISGVDLSSRKVTLVSSETIKVGRYVAFYSVTNPSIKSKLDEIPCIEAFNSSSNEVTLSFLPSWVTAGMKLALVSVDDDFDDGYTVY